MISGHSFSGVIDLYIFKTLTLLVLALDLYLYLDFFFGLLNTGSDTTANTVAFAVYLLSRHGGAETEMVAEIDAYYKQIAQAAPGEKNSRPTFDELDKFPYVEQVRNPLPFLCASV